MKGLGAVAVFDVAKEIKSIILGCSLISDEMLQMQGLPLSIVLLLPATMLPLDFMASHSTFVTKSQKCQWHGGAKGKIKGSQMGS